MNAIVTKEHKKAAQALRKVLAKFAEVELLVQIGEYKKGSDKEADDALARINAVNAFLRQGLDEKALLRKRCRRCIRWWPERGKVSAGSIA